MDRLSPAAGSAVMGTGIVSVALAMDHQPVLSRTLLAIAALIWIGLGIVLCVRLATHRVRLLDDARSPGALTGVAATAVLGTGALQLNWTLVGSVLLGLAAIAWPPLTWLVFGRLGERADGRWFMLTVATEGLAALAAVLAIHQQAAWLTHVALVLAAAGVVLYPFVLVRFDLHDLGCGRGEHWISGGSLAISALAFAQIVLAIHRLGPLFGAAGVLADVAFILWTAAIMWLVALVISELRWPRLHYHALRWSTVFPLGMYAACSFSVATATRTPLLGDFARIWIWIAVAGWTLTFAGTLRHGIVQPPARRDLAAGGDR